MNDTANPIPTRERILEMLKRRGELTAQAIADDFAMTAMAVRQHLYELRKDGLVEDHARPQGRGRPQKYWSLTQAADQVFPDAHQALSLELIAAIRMTFGEEGMDRLIHVRGKQQRAGYGKLIPEKAPLDERVRKLAKIRSSEGYMAEVIADDDEDDGLLLVENHCPICSAARTCSGICREELSLFRDTLGPDVSVERTEHIIKGARRCAYRIKPAAKGGDD